VGDGEGKVVGHPVGFDDGSDVGWADGGGDG
jgi:hypothetical protein